MATRGWRRGRPKLAVDRPERLETRMRSRLLRMLDRAGTHAACESNGVRRIEELEPMADQTKPFKQYHKDGSLWAKGQVVGSVPVGYWEWYRKTGTISRSGTFEDGIQVGEWTTYDKDGNVYKVTQMKPGAKGKGKAERATVDLAKNEA